MRADWLEMTLENYVKNDISVLAMPLLLHPQRELNLIGTQIKCMYGRIDMLAWSDNYLFVIEFKAVNAGEKELGQVVRYSNLIESVVNVYQHLDGSAFRVVTDPFYQVIPVLIAPSFDKKLSSSNCLLVEANSDNGHTFEFERYYGDLDDDDITGNNELRSVLADFERYQAGKAIGDIMRRTINREECLSHLREDMTPPF